MRGMAGQAPTKAACYLEVGCLEWKKYISSPPTLTLLLTKFRSLELTQGEPLCLLSCSIWLFIFFWPKCLVRWGDSPKILHILEKAIKTSSCLSLAHASRCRSLMVQGMSALILKSYSKVQEKRQETYRKRRYKHVLRVKDWVGGRSHYMGLLMKWLFVHHSLMWILIHNVCIYIILSWLLDLQLDTANTKK